MKLYSYQEPAATALELALRKHRVALDTSDTGTGKTVTSCFVASQLGFPVVVVCPKVVIPAWRRTLAAFGITAEVWNWEKVRTGRTTLGGWHKKQFQWNLSADSLLIFDEAHRAKGDKSQNSKLVRAAKQQGIYHMLLSATLADSPLEMRAVGYSCDMHSWDNWWNWCKRNGCKAQPFGGLYFSKKASEKVLPEFHNYLFPEYGARVRIKDLGDLFPETQITAEVFDFGDAQSVYDAAEEEIRKLGEENFQANALVAQLRAWQEVERRKIDGLIRMANDAVEEGNSVVVFTNFRETLFTLCESLKCGGIYGGQKDDEREEVIRKFQADEQRIIVCNAEAGGVGVSLHDEHGNYPRMSLICPCRNPKTLRQLPGRIRRANGKTKSIQRIVYADNSVEVDICNAVNKRLHNLDLLNDGILLNGIDDQLSEPARMNLPSDPDWNPITAEVAEACLRLPTELLFGSPPTQVDPHGVKAEPRGHARYSPSSLKYRMACPGFFSDNSPDRDQRAAIRGTRGHEAWEKGTAHLITDDPSLRTAVEKCAKYSRSIPGRKYKEEKLYVLDQYGFFDEISDDEEADEVHLLDAKFSNNRHWADSPQFWAYCVGIWNDKRWIKRSKITVHVLMPFLDIIEKHTFGRDQLEELKLRVFSIIQAAKNEDPNTFRPFHGCVYCGRAPNCPALAKLGMEIANRYGGSTIEIPSGSLHGSEITEPDVFAKLLEAAPVVEAAASSWKRGAVRLVNEEGITIPGYEMVERTGNRKITNAKTAYDLFLERGGHPDEFAQITEVGLGPMEDLFASLAPKGQKGAWKQDLNDLLTDREAITLGQTSFYLRKQKNKE